MHLNCSIVKVRGQISLLRRGSIVFGLSDYPVSEFELVAEELLMSDSIIKASFSSGLWSFLIYVNHWIAKKQKQAELSCA